MDDKSAAGFFRARANDDKAPPALEKECSTVFEIPPTPITAGKTPATFFRSHERTIMIHRLQPRGIPPLACARSAAYENLSAPINRRQSASGLLPFPCLKCIARAQTDDNEVPPALKGKPPPEYARHVVYEKPPASINGRQSASELLPIP